MDKRLLFFFAFISLGFFGLHYWTDGKQQEEKKKIELQAASQKKKFAEKTASVSELPIVKLYAAHGKDEKPVYAVKIDEQYLLFSDHSLPKELYTETGNLLKAAISQTATHMPQLYTSHLQKLVLPSSGFEEGSELQLVFLQGLKNPTISYGQIQKNDKVIAFPEQIADALALVKRGKSYCPIGIYDSESKTVRSFKDFLPFQGLVQNETTVFQGAAGDEQFYVLENEFQQLVFSNRGGALAEVNLPFHSEKNPKSLVKKIEFDRTLQEKYSQNDTFPQRPFLSDLNSGKTNDGKLGGYYPLLRRSFFDSNGKAKKILPSKFYALNIVGSGSEDLFYRVTSFTKDSIEFEAELPSIRIVKTYSFPKDREAPYIFDLIVRIEGDTKDLWLGTGVPEVELISGSFTPALKYRQTRGQKTAVEKLKLPSDTIVASSVKPDWISNSNGFFGLILDPTSEINAGYKATFIPGASAPSRITVIDSKYSLYPIDKYPGYEMFLPLKGNQTSHFRVFAGPYQNNLFHIIDETYSNPEEGYNPDYSGAQSFHGWFSFISEPFAKFLFFLMRMFYSITHSWGFSIILLTIALRIMLYPLNAWSIKASTRMQQIAPQIKAIQEKYKKDPKKMQIEIMQLYRHSGANPFMGCFPILIQMPFLIGMFDLLKSTFELRGASFIPGWIDNLTAPDVLFSWSYPIFFLGTQFHLLPFLLGFAMYLQQKYTAKITATSSSDVPLTDQQKQQKAMGNIMIVVFTVLFYHFPSGLNIYWLSSMLLGILQQWMMKKKMVVPKPAPIQAKIKKK